MARGEAVESEVHEKPVTTEIVEASLTEEEVRTDGLNDGLTDPGSVLSEPPELDEDRPTKRQREMTLEEYEAMLDAENGPGGFLEGGDIAGAARQNA